jgi:hypothetical protein
MERLASGKAPLLNSHSNWSLSDIIDIVESADLSGKARVRFSGRPEVDPIWQDVQDGIIRNASVGMLIHKLKDTSEEDSKTKSYLAIDWEPLEVSLVPVGADPNAGFDADDNGNLKTLRANAQKGEQMSTTPQAGADAGVKSNEQQIREIGQALKLSPDFVNGAITADISIEDARKKFFAEKVRQDKELGEISNISMIQDRGDSIRLGMEEALFSRMTGKEPAEIGREFGYLLHATELRSICTTSKGVRSKGYCNWRDCGRSACMIYVTQWRRY